jgi:transcriptional regulator with XRE-family HTH domain
MGIGKEGYVTSRWEELGKTVRAERARKGLTQKELAELIGSSPATISNIECNMRNLSLDTLIRVLDALDIEYDIGGYIKSGQGGSDGDTTIIRTIEKLLDGRKVG